MNQSTAKDQEARILAEKHYEVEPGLTQVFRVEGSADKEILESEPIKLLEVNQDTVSSGILPIGFGPSLASGLRFPTIIIEVTPEEYEKIRSHELTLPHGWKLGSLIPRPELLATHE